MFSHKPLCQRQGDRKEGKDPSANPIEKKTLWWDYHYTYYQWINKSNWNKKIIFPITISKWKRLQMELQTLERTTRDNLRIGIETLKSKILKIPLPFSISEILHSKVSKKYVQQKNIV